jgi:Cupin
MTRAPDVLLRTPERSFPAPGCAFRRVAVVRLRGGVFLHAEFTAPWCMFSQIAPEDCGSLLEGAEHLVLYHYVVEGHLTAQIPNSKPVEIEAGESLPPQS